MDQFHPNLSGELLASVRLEKATDVRVAKLSRHNLSSISSGLSKDALRKAFWINLYNAWFQILFGKEISRKEIFTFYPFQFADFSLTLDEMEHGILRKLKPHPNSGLPTEYSAAVNQLALEEEDPRIHFALNCGVKSCPPIAFYDFVNIDKQLASATAGYLEQATHYNSKNNTVTTNELLRWYAMDFGGEEGILHLLKTYRLIPEAANPELKFSAYDRELTTLDFRK